MVCSIGRCGIHATIKQEDGPGACDVESPSLARVFARGLAIQPADTLWCWEPGSNPRPACKSATSLASGWSTPHSCQMQVAATRPIVSPLSSISSHMVSHLHRPCEAAACTEVGMTIPRFTLGNATLRETWSSYLLVLLRLLRENSLSVPLFSEPAEPTRRQRLSLSLSLSPAPLGVLRRFIPQS